jgi:hypothetical protein
MRPIKLFVVEERTLDLLRIKKVILPGCAVVLNHYARNTVFTMLDFESNHD